MLKKIGQILLIPVLLVSTMGITINMHYCQHKLYDVGIFGKAENCCAPKDTKHHTNAHHCMVNNHHKSDCEDETIKIDKIDTFVVNSFDFSFEDLPLQTLFAFYSIFADLNTTSEVKQIEIPDLNISPPGIKVVLSLLQAYLI